MRTLAVEGDANTIASGENWSCLCADLSRRVSEHVLRERNIRFRDTVAQTVVQHGFSSTGDLFRRLKQRDESPRPRLRRCCQNLRCAQQTRHMRVMATGMCDVNGVAAVITCS